MSGDFTAAKLQHAQILLEQGRYPEAEKALKEALSQNPSEPHLIYILSRCQWQQDKSKEALETIDRAIALHPFEGDFFALRAMILAGLHQTKEALKSAGEAISLDPRSAFAFAAKATVHAESMQWKECEATAREALSIDPDHELAASLLANALRHQNRLGESGDQIAYMLSKNPEASYNHVNAGWNALQKGDHKQAQVHFLEALRLDSNDDAAREGLKEAFRARSSMYRAYLKYCFFMQRFTAEKQWALLIGFIILLNVSRAIFVGPLALLGLLIAVLYLLFVLWVHLARSVGNLQLLLDRFARHALTFREKIEAVAAGGAVVGGLVMFVAGLALGVTPLFIMGMTFLGAAVPLAYTFTNPSRNGTLVFGACAAYVLFAGIALAVEPWLKLGINTASAAQLAIYVVIGVTWLSSVPALRR